MLFCELLVAGVLQTKTAELLLRNQWRILGRGPANPPPHRGAPTPPLGRMRPPSPPPPSLSEGLDPPLETARMTKIPLMPTAI